MLTSCPRSLGRAVVSRNTDSVTEGQMRKVAKRKTPAGVVCKKGRAES